MSTANVQPTDVDTTTAAAGSPGKARRERWLTPPEQLHRATPVAERGRDGFPCPGHNTKPYEYTWLSLAARPDGLCEYRSHSAFAPDSLSAADA